jgi:hypothetical protein
MPWVRYAFQLRFQRVIQTLKTVYNRHHNKKDCIPCALLEWMEFDECFEDTRHRTRRVALKVGFLTTQN